MPKKNHPSLRAERSNLEAKDRHVARDDGGKIQELTADLQRIQAEFMNFKRRTDQGRTEIIDLAKQDVVLQILPVFDNIDRALGHLPADLQDHPWSHGVEQVAKQAADTLARLGITKIPTVGQPFDPSLHEAVGSEGGDEVVTAELAPGYQLGNRVLRPAMVKVGRRQHG
jgi:molecular chaperone GrpE